MIYLIGAVLALVVIRWFPAAFAVIFCLAVIVIAFGIFYVASEVLG